MSIIFYSESPIPLFSPVCTYCKHLRPAEGDNGRTCAAFPEPDSIPLDIWNGDDPHTTPHHGDNGIQFEHHAPHKTAAPQPAKGKRTAR